MITKDNFKQLLQHLKFSEKDTIFTKTIFGSTLQVDFTKEKIIYPKKLIVNEQQTCNLSFNENFVVFECVHRLLEKDYNPEHLELEPKWKLGHGASGGRADILVKDQKENTLLIIECKTWNEEFEKEKNKMLGNGGQLFSYFQQEKSTRYLCLYASTFEGEKIIYENAIVKTIDRKEDLEAFKNGDESIKLYEKAKNNKELFEVWKETFNRYFHYNGIFEYDVNAYEIELKPLKRENLKPFKEATGLFNAFMEILRHNNISDNANAFNRILSLLLCKIVDEEKGQDQVLDFQVKEGEDSPEKIQDRLQKLYAKGMSDHLDEEIVYFEDKKIKDIIKLYPRETPLEKIEDIFKQIKYYTQNEFAIKEVHNKELFLQNARVLNEIIKMLQNYQFRYTKKQQMLGDFFELLLNHGIKQNEGQFFTPVPIVRFMILSLGLGQIAKNKLAKGSKTFLPKILDYACGAGHFLTESIDELQRFVEQIKTDTIKDKELLENIRRYKESTQWAKDYIYGIEKDYRLARTSQIACFLNGDGDANILYGDGLENHDRLNCKKDKNLFDVILSNPPYSIKSFKNYLPVNEKQFSLFNCLTENSKEIENLFVERTAQLLKEGGRAAIILPSSILSNDSDLHKKTRQILLEHFNIKAIASFGGGTFGATGTNIVILFLEKRSFDFAKDRQYICEDIFRGTTYRYKGYLDRERLLNLFVNHRELDIKDYRSLMYRISNKNIQNKPFYKDYQNWFENLTDIKNLKKKKIFKALEKEEQHKQLEDNFYNKVLEIEQEKFYYFMLTLKDDFRKKETNGEAYKPQKTVIVQSGEKDIAKAFLGYEFSNRKGSEGIKINRNEKGQAINKMVDDNDHLNPQKAGSYILKHFENMPFEKIDPAIKEHLKIARLTDMLDFEKVELNNALSLNPKINTGIETQWELVKLGEYIKEHTKSNIKVSDTKNNMTGKYPFYTSGLNIYKHDDFIIENKNIFLSTGGHAIVQYFDGRASYSADTFAITSKNEKELLTYYLFCLLKKEVDKIENMFEGIALKHLQKNDFKSLKIPLPPLEVQQKIVGECEAIDKATKNAIQTIEQCKNEIEKEFKNVFNQNTNELFSLNNQEYFDIFIGKRILKEEIDNENGTIPVYSANVFEPFGKINKSFILDFSSPSILWGIDGDWMVNYISENQKFYPTDHCGVIRVLTNKVVPKFLAWALNKIGIDKQFTRTYRASTDRIKNIKIPLPPLNFQKTLVKKVEQLEQKINNAQQVVDGASQKKEAILKKWL